MTQKRQTTLKYTLLTAAAGLIIACWLALVGTCGPAAPPASTIVPTPTPTVRWLGDTPSPSELATLNAIPTATPYPPGYVKPTDLPTYTPEPPLPTLQAQIRAEESALQTMEAKSVSGATGNAAGVAVAEDSAMSEALDLVVKYMARGEYDAIARIRVRSSRNVRVPDIGSDPSSELVDARRDTVSVITTYQGTLPAEFDIVSYAVWSHDALDSGQEYILGVYRFWIPEDNYSSNEPWRAPFNQAVLDAAGGEAYAHTPRLLWVVDGQIARMVPTAHAIWGRNYSSHLEAARDGGLILPVSSLEAALIR